MKKCNSCGGEVIDSAKKCKHCGEWLTPEKNKENGAGCGCLINGIIIILVILGIFGYFSEQYEKETYSSPIENEFNKAMNDYIDLHYQMAGYSKQEAQKIRKKEDAEREERHKKIYEVIPSLSTYEAKLEEIKNEYKNQYSKTKERNALGLNVDKEEKILNLLDFKKEEIQRILSFNSVYDYACCENPKSSIPGLSQIAYKVLDIQKSLQQGTITKNEYDELINRLYSEMLLLQHNYNQVISLTEKPNENPFYNSCCNNKIDKISEMRNKRISIQTKTQNYTACKPSTLNTDKQINYKGFKIDYVSADFSDQEIQGFVDACITDGKNNSQEQLNCCVRSNLYLDKELARY